MIIELFFPILVIAIMLVELTRYTEWGRTFTSKGSENVVAAHSIYNIGLKPNSYAKIYDPKQWDDYSHILKYDSNSLRFSTTPNLIQEKSEDEFRILIIGDSMVQSREVPYEHSFPVLLEKILQNNFQNVKVIPYGVSGWSTLVEYLYYKTEGYRFLPDVVVICFFVNDVTEDAILYDKIIFNKNEIPVAIASKDPRRVVQEILNESSHESKSIILNLIKLGLKTIKEKINRQELREQYKQSTNFHERENLCTDYLAILNENFSENEMNAFNKTLSYISLLNNEITKNGSKMILMCIPLPQQINLKQCGIMANVWNYRDSDSFGNPQSILQKYLEENGIEFLDLLPEFKKNSDKEVYYFAASVHPNKIGSKKIAEVLATFISKNFN